MSRLSIQNRLAHLLLHRPRPQGQDGGLRGSRAEERQEEAYSAAADGSTQTAERVGEEDTREAGALHCLFRHRRFRHR